jgi:hypothetical protein
MSLSRIVPLIWIAVAGCGEDPTIWSAQSPAPDGYWTARAHSVLHTGPGANGVETIVTIERKTTLQRTFQVLGFSRGGESMSLIMRWITPRHLEVLYKADSSALYYQVVKTSGVEISVRNLAEDSAATMRSSLPEYRGTSP